MLTGYTTTLKGVHSPANFQQWTIGRLGLWFQVTFAMATVLVITKFILQLKHVAFGLPEKRIGLGNAGWWREHTCLGCVNDISVCPVSKVSTFPVNIFFDRSLNSFILCPIIFPIYELSDNGSTFQLVSIALVFTSVWNAVFCFGFLRRVGGLKFMLFRWVN